VLPDSSSAYPLDQQGHTSIVFCFLAGIEKFSLAVDIFFNAQKDAMNAVGRPAALRAALPLELHEVALAATRELRPEPRAFCLRSAAGGGGQ
jgi:hypothetical protein